jgi:hypothetical protein
VRKAVADSVPPSFRELNLQAFEKGFDYGNTALAGAPPRMGLQELAHSNEQNYTTAFYGFVALSKAKDPRTPVVTLMSRSP